MGELIFEEAYLRREIYVSKLVGLASQLEGNLPFLFCFVLLCSTLYLRAIFQIQALWGRVGGAYIWRSDLMEGFLHFRFVRAFVLRLLCLSCSSRHIFVMYLPKGNM